MRINFPNVSSLIALPPNLSRLTSLPGSLLRRIPFPKAFLTPNVIIAGIAFASVGLVAFIFEKTFRSRTMPQKEIEPSTPQRPPATPQGPDGSTSKIRYPFTPKTPKIPSVPGAKKVLENSRLLTGGKQIAEIISEEFSLAKSADEGPDLPLGLFSRESLIFVKDTQCTPENLQTLICKNFPNDSTVIINLLAALPPSKQPCYQGMDVSITNEEGVIKVIVNNLLYEKEENTYQLLFICTATTNTWTVDFFHTVWTKNPKNYVNAFLPNNSLSAINPPIDLTYPTGYVCVESDLLTEGPKQLLAIPASEGPFFNEEEFKKTCNNSKWQPLNTASSLLQLLQTHPTFNGQKNLEIVGTLEHTVRKIENLVLLLFFVRLKNGTLLRIRAFIDVTRVKTSFFSLTYHHFFQLKKGSYEELMEINESHPISTLFAKEENCKLRKDEPPLELTFTLEDEEANEQL